MDSNTFLLILIAIVVVLLAWGVLQLFGGFSDHRKKIKERLTGESKGGSEGFDPASFTVLRSKVEIKGVSGIISRIPLMPGLAKKLAHIWPSISLAKFAFITAGAALTGFGVLFVLTNTFFLASVGAVVAMAIPTLFLNGRMNKYHKNFMEQLPEGLDFLSRVLRAGHSLSTGLQMMGEELPAPLSTEFSRCYDQHSLGQPLEEALKDAAVRVDQADFGFFVTAILIQRQTGGDLSEVLSNISGMIRQRIRLQSHVKAKTAEGRFTGYILVAFPIILFFLVYYLQPGYALVLLHTTTGLELLGTAAGMLILGTVAIRKITTIKV